jgi:hypothetical protein
MCAIWNWPTDPGLFRYNERVVYPPPHPIQKILIFNSLFLMYINNNIFFSSLMIVKLRIRFVIFPSLSGTSLVIL